MSRARTYDVVWNVPLGRKAARVRGFYYRDSEDEHVRKHFLNPVETWEELRPPSSPAELRRRLMRGEDDGAVMDDGATAYVDCVRRQTQGHAVFRSAQGYHRTENGQLRPATKVVSQKGIFSAFHPRRQQLVLVTSFAPRVKLTRPGRERDSARLSLALRILKRNG